MLYSYDIFDTLITRKTATPQGIFAIVGCKIKENYPEIDKRLCRDFFSSRIMAERMAHSKIKGSEQEEITFDDIYRCLGKMSALTKEDLETIRKIELETEYDNIVGIDKNISDLKYRLEDGNRVVLISDMYLDQKHIRQLLVKCDSIFEEIPIYVSSDHNALKGTGKLFHYVRRKELIRWRDWKHKGDNCSTDIDVPGKLGICVERYEYEPFLECESEMLDHHQHDVTWQIFIGASRNYRLKKGNLPAVKLGAYGGAILLQYTFWVLSICKMKGIQDIFFVARDGEIILKLAQLINEHSGKFFNLNYIYGSRKAWKITRLGCEDTYDLEVYLKSMFGRSNVSIEEISKCIGLLPSELRKYVNLEAYDDKKQYFWDDMENNPFHDINENDNLKAYLLEKYSDNCKIIQEYLRQEIPDTSKPVAFVELLGTGITQDFIVTFAKEELGLTIVSLFYSLSKELDTKNSFYNYLAGEGDYFALTEALTRALHGKVSGYKNEGKVIVPVLEEDDDKALIAYGYDNYIDAVLNIVNDYLSCIISNGILDHSFELGDHYYKHLVKLEKGDLFEYFCDIPISNTIDGEDFLTSYAAKISDNMIECIPEKGLGFVRTFNYDMSYKRCDEQQINRILSMLDKFSEKCAEEYRSLPRSFQYDCSRLKRRVIIYGEGDFGKWVFEQIQKSMESEVIAWVDKKNVKKSGIHDTIESIPSYQADQVIIAILDENIANEVITDLILLGCDPNIIFWEKCKRVLIGEV